MVAGIVSIHLDRLGAPYLALGSFGFVEFVRILLALSFASFWIVWFVGVPLGSLGSFGLVRFVRVCVRVRWVRSGSSGSSSCATDEQ